MDSVRTAGVRGTKGRWGLPNTTVRVSTRSPEQVRENGRHRSGMVTSLTFVALRRGSITKRKLSDPGQGQRVCVHTHPGNSPPPLRHYSSARKVPARCTAR